jgi:hypothetical protein
MTHEVAVSNPAPAASASRLRPGSAVPTSTGMISPPGLSVSTASNVRRTTSMVESVCPLAGAGIGNLVSSEGGFAARWPSLRSRLRSIGDAAHSRWSGPAGSKPALLPRMRPGWADDGERVTGEQLV